MSSGVWYVTRTQVAYGTWPPGHCTRAEISLYYKSDAHVFEVDVAAGFLPNGAFERAAVILHGEVYMETIPGEMRLVKTETSYRFGTEEHLMAWAAEYALDGGPAAAAIRFGLEQVRRYAAGEPCAPMGEAHTA